MALALAEAFIDARKEVLGDRIIVTNLRNASVAGGVNRDRFPVLSMQLAQSKVFLGTIEVVGGIQQYARDQLNDQTYDVGARFQDVQNGLTTLVDWILANYPLSPATQHHLTSKFNPDGTFSVDTFTIAQTAGFVTAADLFIATANAFLT